MKTRKAWIRALHTFAFAINRFLTARGYYKVRLNPYGREYPVPDFKRLSALRSLWPAIELLSAVPVIATRVKIPSHLGRVIICERYTIDSVASIAYLTEDQGFPQRLVARILLALMPPEYISISLDCDYSTIISRRKTFAEPEDFIEVQRTIYARVAKSRDALSIETSKFSVEETQGIIREYVTRRLGLEQEVATRKNGI